MTGEAGHAYLWIYLEVLSWHLETGVRSVILLDTAYPRSFDLMQLTWLDHLVVHTADIDGPKSLHPNIPQRNGELLVRRSLVEEGLTLMRRKGLLKRLSEGPSVMAF